MVDVKDILANEDEATSYVTEEVNELLHMLLDLKQDKETDLYLMQSIILDMYRHQMELVHTISNLNKELEMRKRKVIEIPKFMLKEKEAR